MSYTFNKYAYEASGLMLLVSLRGKLSKIKNLFHDFGNFDLLLYGTEYICVFNIYGFFLSLCLKTANHVLLSVRIVTKFTS